MNDLTYILYDIIGKCVTIIVLQYSVHSILSKQTLFDKNELWGYSIFITPDLIPRHLDFQNDVALSLRHWGGGGRRGRNIHPQ